MGFVKILERKEVIRFFGVALLLAPLVNAAVSLALQSHIPNRWTLTILWKVVQSSSLPINILSISSVIIGIMMLSGSRKTWSAVLVLVGGYLSWQLANLGQNVKSSWVHGLFFIVNVIVFAFIADQLVWKVRANAPEDKPKTPADPKPKPYTEEKFKLSLASNPEPKPQAPPPVFKNKVSYKSHKKIVVHMPELGTWAELKSITPAGLHLKSVQDVTTEVFQMRPLEITLKNQLTIKTHFKSQDGQDFYFEFEKLSPAQVHLLNKWLLGLATPTQAA